MNKENCVFAGTFDPVTIGHENIIKRCLKEYSRVVVVIGENADKSPLFSIEQRKRFLLTALSGCRRVTVTTFAEHKSNYAEFLKNNKITVYVRGVRSEKDKEYEEFYARKNAVIYPFVKTKYMVAENGFDLISSSLVRERISIGADFADLLSPDVYAEVKKSLKENKR